MMTMTTRHNWNLLWGNRHLFGHVILCGCCLLLEYMPARFDESLHRYEEAQSRVRLLVVVWGPAKGASLHGTNQSQVDLQMDVVSWLLCDATVNCSVGVGVVVVVEKSEEQM